MTKMDADLVDTSTALSYTVEYNLTFSLNKTASSGLPTAALAIVSVLYTLAILLSLIGNSLMLFVMLLVRNIPRDLRYMLLSLTCSSLMMTIACQPFTFLQTVLNKWVFGSVLCPPVMFLQNMSVAVNIYSNIAIGAVRFRAIAFPFKQKPSSKHIKTILAAVWFACILFASVQFYAARLSSNAAGAKCIEQFGDQLVSDVYEWLVLSLLYLIPVVLLFIFYAATFVELKKTASIALGVPRQSANDTNHTPRCSDNNLLQRPLNTETTLTTDTSGMISVNSSVVRQQSMASKSDSRKDKNNKVLKLVVILISSFVISWLPLHLFFALIHYARHLLPESNTDKTILYTFSHWLAMSNTFQMPAIYVLNSTSFKDDFQMARRRAQCCCPNNTSSPLMGNRSYYNSTANAYTTSSNAYRNKVAKLSMTAC